MDRDQLFSSVHIGGRSSPAWSLMRLKTKDVRTEQNSVLQALFTYWAGFIIRQYQAKQQGLLLRVNEWKGCAPLNYTQGHKKSHFGKGRITCVENKEHHFLQQFKIFFVYLPSCFVVVLLRRRIKKSPFCPGYMKSKYWLFTYFRHCNKTMQAENHLNYT